MFAAVHRNALLLVLKGWRRLTLFFERLFKAPKQLRVTGLQLAFSSLPLPLSDRAVAVPLSPSLFQ